MTDQEQVAIKALEVARGAITYAREPHHLDHREECGPLCPVATDGLDIALEMIEGALVTLNARSLPMTDEKTASSEQPVQERCGGSGVIRVRIPGAAAWLPGSRGEKPCPGCPDCRPCRDCEGEGGSHDDAGAAGSSPASGNYFPCERCRDTGVEPDPSPVEEGGKRCPNCGGPPEDRYYQDHGDGKPSRCNHPFHSQGRDCYCCGKPAPIRGEGDPWQGRLDGYCEDCATARCDAYAGACQTAPERWRIFKQTYGKGKVEAIDGPDTPVIEVVPASALSQAQAERDAAYEGKGKATDADFRFQYDRAESAESERDALREALTHIRAIYNGGQRDDQAALDAIDDVAETALASSGEDG